VKVLLRPCTEEKKYDVSDWNYVPAVGDLKIGVT
jgi:hypothetical protein